MEFIPADFIVAIVMISGFCLCCYLLLRSIIRPIPMLYAGPYNRSALKLKRAYLIFAHSTMTFAFLIGVMLSFYRVYMLL